MSDNAPALRPPPEYADLRWHWIKQASGELIVMAWTISNKWADHVGFLSPETAWGQLWRYHGPCIPTAIVPDSADEAMVEVVCRATREAEFGEGAWDRLIARESKPSTKMLAECRRHARAVLDALRAMGERG